MLPSPRLDTRSCNDLILAWKSFLFFFKALARAATAVENNIHVVATGKVGMFCQKKKELYVVMMFCQEKYMFCQETNESYVVRKKYRLPGNVVRKKNNGVGKNIKLTSLQASLAIVLLLHPPCIFRCDRSDMHLVVALSVFFVLHFQSKFRP